MSEVALEAVTKIYPGGRLAVNEVTLSVRPGELLAIVGPSGCGKTTLLRLVAGLEELTSGAIRIGSRLVSSVPPRDRDVAMVFQSYALFPHMSVRENLAFGLGAARLSAGEVDGRVRSAAEMLGLSDALDRRPASLSGGERQRVALGRAIVRRPAALLLDEPLNSLDARLRAQMRSELRRLHRELRTTSLYVTHDQEEALTLGDRVAVMREGAIEQVGEPLEIYDRPANRFVAGFVGTPPMSFLPGRLTREADRVFFEIAGGPRLGLSSKAAPPGSPAGELILGVRPDGMRIARSAATASTGAGGTGAGGTGAGGTGAGGTGAGSASAAAGSAILRARVSEVEILGHRQHVHLLAAGGHELVARIEAAERFQPGDEFEVALDPGRAHLFDPAAGGRRVA